MTDDLLASASGYRIQKTLRAPILFKGTGLHTGEKTKIRLIPAPENHGIQFARVDLKPVPRLFAHYDAVVSTSMATSLGLVDRPEATIHTVEHILAATYAMGITNLLIEVSGPEIPILDGSARVYVEAFLETGIELQPFSTPTLRVLKPIKVYENGAICELLPRDRLRLTTSVDFPHPSIGLQTYALELTPRAFLDQIGSARTFGFQRDLDKLKARNLARGASLENVLGFSDDGVLNPEGMRFNDECVRHKLLDALGDLALCGAWLEAEMVSFRGGHSIHLALLKTLKAKRSQWELLPAIPVPLHPLRSTFQPELGLILEK